MTSLFSLRVSLPTQAMLTNTHLVTQYSTRLAVNPNNVTTSRGPHNYHRASKFHAIDRIYSRVFVPEDYWLSYCAIDTIR